ncbi:hypothetical protein KI387_036399, partial [Taxus chinensis]
EDLANLEKNIIEEGMDINDYHLEKNLLADYHTVAAQEETFWRQKSRALWLKDGDQNTKYFHLTTIHHKSHNRINEITTADGDTSKDPIVIKEEAMKFYKTLLNRNHNHEGDPMEFINNIPSNLIDTLSFGNLTAKVIMEELQKNVFAMEGDKSPGPDGFPASFYQKYWEICNQDLLKA